MDETPKKPQEQDEPEGHLPQISRRDFLKGMGTGAVTATVVGAGALSPPDAEARTPAGVKEAVVRLTVNGRLHRLRVKSHWTLAEVLRREIGLTGTKKFCDRGSCGACTVVMDGKAIYSCSRLAIEADEKKIITIEGLSNGERLHPVQQAFVEHDGLQCGFCTAGAIMSVQALLAGTPQPTIEEMKESLSGNICRCSAYPKILQSAMAAAQLAK